MKSRPFTGIVVGSLAALLFAFGTATLASWIFASSTGATFSGLDDQAIAALSMTPALRVVGYLCVFMACLLGGAIAARFSRLQSLALGALSSWLFVGLGVYSAFSQARDTSLLELAGTLLALPAFGVLGAYLHRRFSRAVAPLDRTLPMWS
ncbi:MAG: hypothetical protein IBJ03_10910 [Gemmatimonadaceae bacterium]|nr:hypothetical protein [Gemmatimonadaceae bacterium]